MKILSVHNFYYITGGSDRCFFDLNRLLESKGHKVIPFSTKSPQNFPSEYADYFVPQMDFNISRRNFKQIRSFINMIYSFPAKRNIEELIRDTRPDVAHLHNIYGRISPSILPVLKKKGIPVVQTLHDHKLVCPNHRMFANGKICEECRGGKFYKTVVKRCSHGSALFGTALALEAYFHHWLRIYPKYVDAFISPSIFLKNKLVEHGMDSNKIYILPNFVTSSDSEMNLEPEVDGIYFGSLIPEKGVEVLIRSLIGLKEGKFRIVGDGPLKDNLKKIVKLEAKDYKITIEFTGHLKPDAVKKEVSKSLFVIVPSIWYENYPMSILEAFSNGKPVVGARIGGIPELIKDGEFGLLFQPGDAKDLREKIAILMGDRAKAIEMGQKAKKWVNTTRDPDHYYECLLGLYRKVGA